MHLNEDKYVATAKIHKQVILTQLLDVALTCGIYT